jgi:hypothetical protein
MLNKRYVHTNFCTVRGFAFMSTIREPRQKMLETTTTTLNLT